MTTAMARLQDKVDVQNKAATNLERRFREAMEIAIDDGGLCLDELRYFGVKAFRDVLKQMERKQEEGS